MIVTAIIQILKSSSFVTERVSDRIYPMEFPTAPSYPAIVVQKADGRPEYDMQGDAVTENSVIQVDMYSASGYEDLSLLKEAVRIALSGYCGTPSSSAPCVIQGMFVIRDQDMPVEKTDKAGPKLRRRMLEFNVWSE